MIPTQAPQRIRDHVVKHVNANFVAFEFVEVRYELFIVRFLLKDLHERSRFLAGLISFHVLLGECRIDRIPQNSRYLDFEKRRLD